MYVTIKRQDKSMVLKSGDNKCSKTKLKKGFYVAVVHAVKTHICELVKAIVSYSVHTHKCYAKYKFLSTIVDVIFNLFVALKLKLMMSSRKRQ